MAKNNARKAVSVKPAPDHPRADGKYTESSALDMIRRNGATVGHRSILHPQPGIKVFGAIDFLVRFFGYSYVNPGAAV